MKVALIKSIKENYNLLEASLKGELNKPFCSVGTNPRNYTGCPVDYSCQEQNG